MPQLRSTDALILVDVQNDFCAGGALAVPGGDEVVPVLNRWIEAAEKSGATVVATRDWHPADHVSFHARGGPWPAHCVQNTPGAAFHSGLKLPENYVLVDKATDPDRECYSDFAEAKLAETLRRRDIDRLWVGGLALDYCVRATVLDGLQAGFDVHLILPATRPVDPRNSAATLRELAQAGATIEQE